MVSIPNRAKLKMACGKVQTNGSGYAELLIKVPGTISEDVRVIGGGSGWFDTHQTGDKFVGVDLLDQDELLKAAAMSSGMTEQEALAYLQNQYPDYPKVGSFGEDTTEAPLESGWYFPESGFLEVGSIGGEEDLAAGFYMKFMAQKASAVVDTFRVNLFWGDPR